MQWVLQHAKTFLHPHYISNLLLALLFFGLKTIEPLCDVIFENCELELREWELLTFLGCIIVIKNRKQPTYKQYISTVFMFTKLLNAFLFFRQNIFYGITYVIVCLCQIVLLPEPVYRGPEKITYFTGVDNLQKELDKDNRINWIIEFYAAWSPTCINFAPIFSEISAKYTLPNLKFGKVDITRFSEAAEKYKINNGATSKQIPTLIHFENGKENRRKPFVNERSQVSKFVFTMENVCSGFNLNELYLQCEKNLKGKKRDFKVLSEEKKDK